MGNLLYALKKMPKTQDFSRAWTHCVSTPIKLFEKKERDVVTRQQILYKPCNALDITLSAIMAKLHTINKFKYIFFINCTPSILYG